jgi:hypothetical protein
MSTQSTLTVSKNRTSRASRSIAASTVYWTTMNAAMPASAPSANPPSVEVPTAS